jgi:hypothetical protein
MLSKRREASLQDAARRPRRCDRGVSFANPHSLLPIFTTASPSALATGHKLGDAGDFSNTIPTGFRVGAAGGKPFVLAYWSRDPDGTQHGQGNSLGQVTPGSTARPRSPRSAVPAAIWRGCGRPWPISG